LPGGAGAVRIQPPAGCTAQGSRHRGGIDKYGSETEGMHLCTLEQYERECADLHLLHGVVDYWAARKPDAVALTVAGKPEPLTWGEFSSESAAMARWLVAQGFRCGDFLATQLPFSIDHVLLEYACFRAGVVHTPLDLRLPAADVEQCMAAVQARALFRADDAARCRAAAAALPVGSVPLPAAGENDGAQVIFTTGSTGYPKPALLSHRSITSQNLCLGTAFGFGETGHVLVNLPPSHVGGQAEALMTTLFFGGMAVLVEAFDAARSLAAMESARVTLIGQVPAMFNLEWRLSNFASYDLSSLRFAIYGGQEAPPAFLERLAQMAPETGTGLGLTEASGFCTYVCGQGTVEGLGTGMPVYPLSIRGPMRDDGAAGGVLAPGETGHICFRGPQTFLGYVNDEAATRRTISRDGWLYTGDMGYMGDRGLHFAGRHKWVIKPAGFQVFPAQVEHFMAAHEKVQACGVVGVPHPVFTEAIVAFVERKPGADLTVAELKRHARGLATYMRPVSYVMLDPGGIPLNRVAKTDYLRLREMAARGNS
jgi:fatty-acyl-CoA synthase